MPSRDKSSPFLKITPEDVESNNEKDKENEAKSHMGLQSSVEKKTFKKVYRYIPRDQRKAEF